VALPASFSLRLHAAGFSFGPPLGGRQPPPPSPDGLHPYDRSSRAFLADVEAGRLPGAGLLTVCLPREAQQWREGHLACELHDCRSPGPPSATRLLLRPTTESVLCDVAYETESMASQLRARLAAAATAPHIDALPPLWRSRPSSFVEETQRSVALQLETAVLLRTYPVLALGPLPAACAAAAEAAGVASTRVANWSLPLTPWLTPTFAAALRAVPAPAEKGEASGGSAESAAPVVAAAVAVRGDAETSKARKG